MLQSGIYKIVNQASGKCYVGSAVNIKRRWSEHKAYLRGKYHHSQHLQRAWDLHGEDAFCFEVIEFVETLKLIEREQHWIDVLHAYGKSGYNVSPKAGSSLGIKRSDETRQRISQAKKGFVPWNAGQKTGPQPPELVKRRIDPLRGVSRPDEVKGKISGAHIASGHKPNVNAIEKSAEVRRRNAELRRLGLLPPLYDAERKKAVGQAISAAKQAAKQRRIAGSLLNQ